MRYREARVFSARVDPRRLPILPEKTALSRVFYTVWRALCATSSLPSDVWRVFPCRVLRSKFSLAVFSRTLWLPMFPGVLPGFIGFYRVLSGFVEFCWALPSRVLFGFAFSGAVSFHFRAGHVSTVVYALR
ncbi:hypothetical protein SAMN05421878_101128 [Actinobaculum suis]|uniref:Uncharacterized protein n=1 Tax=Actinobaculum suis TaxID=1657 RepID=A0A1G6ZIB2_9ACTO|nr:hypothetical protein SAMN05421878_101128 [Actinobaculum suis]